MFRRLLVVTTVAAVAGSASADLNACGDKFLRAGRSARNNGYAAVYPASILVYKPNATPKGLKEMESLLKKAGHKPVCFQKGADLSQTLRAAKYDLVIADYADTAALKGQFRAISIDPSLLPILDNATDAEKAEATKQYKYLLTIRQMTVYDALEQIDSLMKLRRKPDVAAAVSK